MTIHLKSYKPISDFGINVNGMKEQRRKCKLENETSKTTEEVTIIMSKKESLFPKVVSF